MGPQLGRKPALASAEDAAIHLVLESDTFRKATALRRVLAHLWENRAQTITEYSIAVDALDRRPDFDPRFDATVRVHIARLRQKLKQYYETEGAGSILVISIPAGSYQLELQQVKEKPPAEGLTPQPMPEPRAGMGWRIMAAVASAIALFSTLLAVYYSHQAARPAAPAELPRFWRAFFGSGKPVKLIIPTPVFLSWPGHNLRVRDVLIDDFDTYEQSADIRRMAKEMGAPKLSQSYTVTSDALGAVHLAQFFAPKGHHLAVVSTGDLSLELFGNHNLILLGMPHTSTHLREFFGRTNFTTLQSCCVLNRHPAPSEPPIWRSSTISAQREIRPGLIALLPGQAASTRLLLIAGGHTASLVSFLISPVSLRALDQVWAQNGSPEHFEFVVLAEVENNSVVKAQPVAFRAVPASIWK